MEKKASEILGEEVIAGVRLEAPSAVKDMVGGGLVGEIVAGMNLKPASLPGDHEGIQYMAVGPTKVGFFSIKVGLFKSKLEQLLVQHPRSEVQTLEIQSGVMPAAHIVLRDGTHYALLCPRIELRKLNKVQELLVK